MNNRVFNCAAFVVLLLLWLGFGAALVFNPGMLGTAWQVFRAWPLVGQAVVTLLTLPVVVGLWVWQMSWPYWLRLVLVVGLAWVTLYMFFPKKAAGQPKSSPAHSVQG